MQIRIGKKLGFAAALVVTVFSSQSASATDYDLATIGNKTLKDSAITTKDNYTNSGEDLRTLTLQLGNAIRAYGGNLSGNLKVVLPDRLGDGKGSYDVSKYVITSAQTQTHTGGTEIHGCTLGFGFGNSSKDITYGTEPIQIYVHSATHRTGGVRLYYRTAVLKNAVKVLSSEETSSGYQGANATIQGTEDGEYTRTFKGSVDATECGGFSIYQGGACAPGGAAILQMSGVINGQGADIYVMSVTNSTLTFANNVTAKSLRMAYFKDKQKYGNIILNAGKNFDIGEIQLAGHFLTINGTLTNPGCVFNWTLPAQGTGTQGPYGTIDEVIAAGEYDGGVALSDPETSKITLVADQTIDHLTSEALTSAQCAEPGMVLRGSKVSLTLKNSAKLAECYARVCGSLSLVLDAADADNVQAFLGRENDTKGSIDVQKGVFKIGAGASFPNMKSVSVAADGTFAVDTSAETVLSNDAMLNFESGAKLTIAEGASLVAGTANLAGVQTTKEGLVSAGILSADDAERLTLTGKLPPVPSVYFYANTSVNIFKNTTAGWFKDRALTEAADAAPQKSTTGAPNIYVAEAGTYANKLPGSNCTFAGDVFQMGNEEKGKTCTMNANAGTYRFDSLWFYGGELGVNAVGTLTLDIQNECKFFKTENDLKFSCLYLGKDARTMAFTGKYVSAGDVDVQCASLYGSAYKDPTASLTEGMFVFKGDYTSFKGRWCGVEPSYGGGVDLRRKVYLCLEAESAFGDQTYIRHDAIVLGCGSVLCVGSDVTTTTNRGVSVYLSKAGQTAYIDTDKYGSVVLNAPVGYTTSSLKDATVTLEKIGENKLTLADKLSVKSVKVTEGSLKLARTATLESGVTIDVAAGAKLYYYQSHLDQGLVITGEGGKFLLSGSAIIIR